jgi:hypothetical protein
VRAGDRRAARAGARPFTVAPLSGSGTRRGGLGGSDRVRGSSADAGLGPGAGGSAGGRAGTSCRISSIGFRTDRTPGAATVANARIPGYLVAHRELTTGAALPRATPYLRTTGEQPDGR